MAEEAEGLPSSLPPSAIEGNPQSQLGQSLSQRVRDFFRRETGAIAEAIGKAPTRLNPGSRVPPPENPLKGIDKPSKP